MAISKPNDMGSSNFFEIKIADRAKSFVPVDRMALDFGSGT